MQLLVGALLALAVLLLLAPRAALGQDCGETNVRSRGATGNGQQNDAWAFRAMDGDPAAGLIYMSAGVYRIAESLTIDKPIIGAEGAVFTVDWGATLTLRNQPEHPLTTFFTGMFSIRGSSSLYVSGAGLSLSACCWLAEPWQPAVGALPQAPQAAMLEACVQGAARYYLLMARCEHTPSGGAQGAMAPGTTWPPCRARSMRLLPQVRWHPAHCSSAGCHQLVSTPAIMMVQAQPASKQASKHAPFAGPLRSRRPALP